LVSDSPQSGLPQNNRVGDLDAEALPYAVKTLGITMEEAQRQLTKESGLKGISGKGRKREAVVGGVVGFVRAVEERGTRVIRELQRVNLKVGSDHVIVLIGVLVDEPCQQFIPIFVIGVVDFLDDCFSSGIHCCPVIFDWLLRHWLFP